MRIQEWKQTQRGKHLRRLGPWLVVSACIWTFLVLGLLPLLPQSAPSKRADPVTMRSVSAKRWMENKSVRQPPQRTKVVQNKPKEEKAEEEKKKPDPIEKPLGQIVDIAMPEREEVPDEAKYVSQYNSAVKKQSKARKRAPLDQVAPSMKREGLKQPQQKMGQDEGKLVLNENPAPDKPGRRIEHNLALLPDLKMAMKLDLEEDGTRGQFKNRKSQERNLKGNADRLQMLFDDPEDGQAGERGAGQPSNIPKSLLPNLESSLNLAGAPMNDYLKDVEEGEETWLNTKSFKYATYYNRIKRKVSQRWNPVRVQNLYDPGFSIYGYQSRYTVLYITLDYSGKLEETEVKRSSGVDFLDREAMDAVARAAPFPNPPTGILESDGKIKFPFGFYFELTRSGLRLR